MVAEYEQFLIDTILPELEQGRPGWDLPHTQSVVEYVQAIAKAEGLSGLEQDILTIVGYLHDYGYMYFRDMVDGGPTGGIPKREHPAKSAEKWDEIRDNPVFNFLDESAKNRIKHLILVHDDVYNLVYRDELLFMEADTLGALSTRGTIDISSDRYQAYLRHTMDKRISRFITDYSQQEAGRLISELLRG